MDPVSPVTWLAHNYPYLIALAVIITLLWNSIVVVGGNEIALIERRWFGSKMPQGRVVALGNEVGIQARTLGPGLHFLIPFIYKATKSVFPMFFTSRHALSPSLMTSAPCRTRTVREGLRVRSCLLHLLPLPDG
jgi:regulator of protease activity HflC (stomatin/prohibitin superfamily)